MKIHNLEKALLGTLVSPQESDQRKRYVKKLIYGELPAEKETVLSNPEPEEAKESIWRSLQRIITGDDYLDN